MVCSMCILSAAAVPEPIPVIQILHSRGLTISGSDVEETKITKAERAMGVTVYLEHDAAHLGRCPAGGLQRRHP